MSAKNNDNIKNMFFNTMANLPFFEQFGDLPKNTILKELGIITILNKDDQNGDNSILENSLINMTQGIGMKTLPNGTSKTPGDHSEIKSGNEKCNC